MCLDPSTHTFDPSRECGCNLLYETTPIFRRCRFLNETIASNYITQGGLTTFDTVMYDVVEARYVIFCYGFLLAVFTSFVITHLMQYDWLGE